MKITVVKQKNDRKINAVAACPWIIEEPPPAAKN